MLQKSMHGPEGATIELADAPLDSESVIANVRHSAD